MEENKELRRSLLIKIAIIAVASLIVILLAVSYTVAASKYKKIIERLEEENKRLSDPVVQYEVASKEVSVALIKSEILNIGELATIEYLYTDAGKFEDSAKLFGKEVPFSTKSFIVKWDGIIKAGIDVNEVTVEVKHSNKEIVVHIPEAKILSHEIEEESIETLDAKNGLFNSIKIEDVREFDVVGKKGMEQRVIEKGLLDKAYENAKLIIHRLINTGVVEELEYTITFN